MEIDLELCKFNIPSGPIGIACSGGADSSLLLYIVLRHTNQPVHVFTGAFASKQNITIKYTSSVIEKCTELTGNKNIQQHIIYDEIVNHKKYLDYIHTYMTQNKRINIFITGITKAPPDSITDAFIDKPVTQGFRLERNPNHEKPVERSEGLISTPFINLNKKHIADLYIKFNLMESLFPLTRSCESFDIFDKHCEKCWFCEERYWAFGRYI